jgi:hypothetical protein
VDDRQFDNWTRALVGRGTRRKVVRGLIGGSALLAAFRRAGVNVAAHHGTAGPGDPCRHDNQCIAADTALVCAWNGFGHDGDFNCCAFDGSRCSDDSGCCGWSTCNGGWCGGGGDASAGSGGVAIADAEGGSVSIGDINSGGNVGNMIRVGNTSGSIWVDGGDVSNVTDISASADAGVAIADASGGSGNIAGGGPYDGSGPGCTGEWCDCWQGPYDDDPCDDGLVCCLQSDDYSGVCIPLYTCTGSGAPGDDCPRYCLPGPGDCPSCVSGYCTIGGYCA